MINKIFGAEASPLYGRRTHEIMLQELPLEKLFAALRTDIEEFIKIWSIFGGVPYYYTLLEQNIPIETAISGMIERRDTMLLDEGKVLLSVEFGKDSKTYNTILTAIAEGKTKLNEIATYFSNKKGDTIKYIDILRKEFGLIKRMTPVLSDPRKSREGLYEINDNLLSFWFYFIDKQRAYIEQERFDEVIAFFNENFPNYTGRKFERFIEYLIKKKILLPDFEFKKVGRQWDRIYTAEERKNQYEIDILGLDDKKKIMLLCECKWQEKINAEKVLEELNMKASYIDAERKEELFAVFAKSFSKKVKDYQGKAVFCFDLRDIGQAIKSNAAAAHPAAEQTIR